MIELVGAAALMGLVGSLHCVGMCGSFALACGGRTSHVASWQLGKLATYVVLGTMAGWFGGVLPGPALPVQLVAATLVIWFGAAALGLVPEPGALPGLSRIGAAILRRPGVLSRATFGAVNGLLPCGLVYAALGLAVAGGSAMAGGVTMAAFGMGTVPALSVFAMSGDVLARRDPRLRAALAVTATLAGLWVVVRRGGMLPPVY